MSDMFEMWYIDTETLEHGPFYNWQASQEHVQQRVDTWSKRVRGGHVGVEHRDYAFFARRVQA